MRDLLYKELRLALHPAALLFLGLSAMLLIPNYPYYVAFFYTALGLFFICMAGRENRDIFYTMLLPVRKRQIVGARFLTAMLLEGAQLLLAVPFAMLRNGYGMKNTVGMEANVAFFGFALGMLGVFNLVFLARYYRNPDQVGLSFVAGSVAIALYMIVAEGVTHAVPFVRDVLDTPDPLYLGWKLLVLGLGLAIYGALTLTAYQVSARRFEALDL